MRRSAAGRRARAHRGRGATERGRARARTVAAGRRGRRPAARGAASFESHGARHRRACGPRPGQRRQRDPGTGAPDRRRSRHSRISSRGISTNVGVIAGGTRANVVAAEARATIDVRVPTMADGARVEQALRALASAADGDPARADRAASIGRRSNEARPSFVSTNRREPSRASSDGNSARVARAADRTGISRRRLVFQL